VCPFEIVNIKGGFMNRFLASVFLALISMSISASAVCAEPREEIRLTTIIPDQQVLRVKKGIISETNYRQSTFPDGNIPAKSLIIEGDVGIGTTSPTQKLEVNGNTKISGNLEVTGSITNNGIGMVPSNYGGEQSVTFPNGLILKMGITGNLPNGQITEITYTTPFPNGVKSVSVINTGLSADSYVNLAARPKPGYAKYKLSIWNGWEGRTDPAYWQVWGY
jgi:hypothetical protein